MSLIRTSTTCLLAGWLISRGGAVDQNWLLSCIGIAIWIRLVFKLDTSKSIQHTFLIWFLVSAFALDWLRVLGWDALFALSTVVGASWCIAIYLWKRLLVTKNDWLNIISLSAIGVAYELIFSNWPFGGFSWLRLGYLLSDLPFIGLTYWFGISIVTFLVIATISCIVSENFTPLRGLSAVVSILVLLLSSQILKPQMQLDTRESLSVLAVQGGVPRVGLDFNSQRAAVFRNHLVQTQIALETSDSEFDLILWPENASDIDPFLNPDVSSAITNLSDSSNTPILLGAVLDQGDQVANAAVLASGEKLETLYIKQKLVPFGEFLPFRNLLSSIISRFDRLSRDFIRGDESNPILIKNHKIGVLICFEVAFDKIWHNYSDADYLVVLTNNATYAGTKQPLQQLRITQLQAISIGAPVMISSTSGISGYIDELGDVQNLISENVGTFFYQEVPKLTNPAPSVVLQPFVHLFMFAILLVALFVRLRTRLIGRNQI